jgi:glutamine amidotransferase
MLVTIIDHGLGNLRSLVSAISHLGHDFLVSSTPKDIASGETLILPGVGSFPIAMAAITEAHLGDVLTETALSGKAKVLGICLGMQLLMSYSGEGGGCTGLDLVGGEVGRFSNGMGLPVPHTGFNAVRAPAGSSLFAGLPEETDFYFVHSYRATVAAPGSLVATTQYGETFVSAFEFGNVYGTQFHPEKSQKNGLRLLNNFLSAEIA